MKKNFDSKYHFPYESYRYVFYFLDIVHELKENNAIYPFESFMDIKDTLRKQWAGLMYESLTKKDRIVNSLIQPLETKIDRLEKSLNKLIDSKTDGTDNRLTFDISSLLVEENTKNLEAAQNKIQQLLTDIRYFSFYDDNGYEISGQRIWFDKMFTNEISKNWLESLRALVQSFKLSKNINSETVFKGFSLSKRHKWYYEISYKTLFELYNLYNSLADDDKNGLVNAVTQELNKSYEKPSTPSRPETNEDLPF